jgi:hypothetical protein
MEVTATITVAARRQIRNMPLLTELVSTKDGLGYQHGAPNGAAPPPLINTPLQRGVRRPGGNRNRFNGFHRARETVETVSEASPPLPTPLKRGVNESGPCARVALMKYPVQATLTPGICNDATHVTHATRRSRSARQAGCPGARATP